MSILSGKTAVITGAGGGIGRAVSLLFARAGAKLVLNDLGTGISGEGSNPQLVADLGRSLGELGAAVVTDASDVATPTGVAQLMDVVASTHGGLDILVNCSGILRERALLNMHADDLTAVFEVHVVGTFRLMQAAALAMRERGGRIVNTTNPSALAGNIGQSSNSAAAAAVIGLTRTAAVELQRHRIYVNAVAPLAKTRQTEALPLFQKAKGLTPEHVALAYLFLASPLAGETSGEILTIAGSRLSALDFNERNVEFVELDGGALDRIGADDPNLAAIREAWDRVKT